MIILGLSANWGATLPKGNLIGDLTSNFLVESCQVKAYFALRQDVISRLIISSKYRRISCTICEGHDDVHHFLLQ